MRIGIVVVGVILLILGAVLLFVPLVPQSNQTVDTSSSLPFIAFQVGGYSVTGSIPVAVSWSSPTSVEVVAATCSGTCMNSNASASGITIQSGTSGSFTLNQPNGGTVGIGVLAPSGSSGSNTTVTFKIATALSTVGTLLLVVGILLLIVGVVVKSKKSAAAASPPALATPPAPDTGAPPTP
jgi:uncharacterized membrane protein